MSLGFTVLAIVLAIAVFLGTIAVIVVLRAAAAERAAETFAPTAEERDVPPHLMRLAALARRCP